MHRSAIKARLLGRSARLRTDRPYSPTRSDWSTRLARAIQRPSVSVRCGRRHRLQTKGHVLTREKAGKKLCGTEVQIVWILGGGELEMNSFLFGSRHFRRLQLYQSPGVITPEGGVGLLATLSVLPDGLAEREASFGWSLPLRLRQCRRARPGLGPVRAGDPRPTTVTKQSSPCPPTKRDEPWP
jgi:hypothetical protein